MPGTLSNNGKKAAFLGMNNIPFGNVFKHLEELLGSIPFQSVDSLRYSPTCSCQALIGTACFKILLEVKSLELLGLSFDLGSCHSLIHIRL